MPYKDPTMQLAATRRWRERNPEKTRELRNASMQRWRERNPERVKENNELYHDAIVLSTQENEQRKRDFVNNYKAQNVCVDCRQAFHPVAMDFDHMRDKSHNIAALVKGSWSMERLLEEIAKCELVCHNCHRIRTLNRLDRWSYRITQLAWVIDEMKDWPCADCSHNFPPECMDFDHLERDSKTIQPSHWRQRSIKRLSELIMELRTCDLVCANCHRVRTNAQRAVLGAEFSSARIGT